MSTACADVPRRTRAARCQAELLPADCDVRLELASEPVRWSVLDLAAGLSDLPDLSDVLDVSDAPGLEDVPFSDVPDFSDVADFEESELSDELLPSPPSPELPLGEPVPFRLSVR